MTGFNKWYPDRPLPEKTPDTALERRARFLRVCQVASTLMLVSGYLVALAFWNK